MYITSNDEHLIVIPSASSDDNAPYGSNTVYYVDLIGNNASNWQRRPLVEQFNAAYSKYNTTVPSHILLSLQLYCARPLHSSLRM